MLYTEILKDDYSNTVNELKNVNCTIDPISGKILHSNIGIVELMELYGTSSCFFFWRFIAQYFSPEVNILISKIKLYVKIQLPILSEEGFIYAFLPYYEYANLLKHYPTFADGLQNRLLTVYEANAILRFKVPQECTADYTKILNSEYSKVSKSYLNLSTANSIANQVCLKEEALMQQWNRISSILNVPLDILLAKDEVYPEFLIEKETYTSKA